MARLPGRAELWLFGAAFCAYLPGIGWGLPEASARHRLDVWSPDDIAPLAPLTELYNTFVHAGPDRFLLYPLFHHFLLAATYAPYLLWLMLTGRFGPPSATYPFGLADSVTAFRVLTVIARLVSIAMAAGVGVIAYRIGTTLWNHRIGLLAFGCCATQYPIVYYAKTGNLDVPVLFWTALGLLVYARMLVLGITIRRAAALGATAALAAATKDQGAAAFLLMPLVLIPLAWWDAHRSQAGSWKPFLALVAAGLGVYAIASGLAVDPSRYLAHIRFLANAEQRNLHFAPFVTWYPSNVSGLAALSAALVEALYWFLGPLLLAAALWALWEAKRHDPLKLAFGMPAVGHFLLFVVPIHYFYLRFAMPIAFVLAIFAGRGLQMAYERWRSRPFIPAALTIAALGWPVALSGDLVFQMVHDSRYEAGRWLESHVRPGQRIGHFGPQGELPRVRADIEPIHFPPGPAAFHALASTRPDVVAILPDWTSRPNSEYSGLCPPSFYEGLRNGSLGYALAARYRTPSLVRRQLLDYPSVNPPITIFVRRDRQAPARVHR